jgi:small-conductance mechanosensitive channel
VLRVLRQAAEPGSDTPDLSEAINPVGVTTVDGITALSIVVGGIAVAVVARRVVAKVFRRGTHGTAHAENIIGHLVQAVIILVSVAYALGVVGVRIGPLLGALGIGGLALALALQPALQNLFSGVVIHAQRPMRIGEEIVTGDVQGTVVDVTSRAVVIRQYSGEIVYIPNSTVVEREVVNLVREGSRRTTVVVGVAYDSELRTAHEVIHRAVVDAAGVLSRPVPRVLATEFADSSVNFEVDFWHRPDEGSRRATRAAVIVGIHEALAEAGITIPFPQRTLWFGHDTETIAPPDRLTSESD